MEDRGVEYKGFVESRQFAGTSVQMGFLMTKATVIIIGLLCVVLILGTGCAKRVDIYHDPNMDFGAVQTVAIMPFANLSRETHAAERVRDVFVNKLLATGAVYVLPVGEVARGVAKMELVNPSIPSTEEIVKLGGIIKVQAILTGAVREYGEVRAGTSAANVISVSAQLTETQTGRVVWSSSTSQGGITVTDRLFGGGGQAMEEVTEKAVDDLINKLFK
jgi:polysaccharide biosynthesis protein PelC